MQLRPKSLGVRLIIPLAGVLIACALLLAHLVTRSQRARHFTEAELGASRLADTVKKATRYDMLTNRRRDISKVIEDVGGQEGIEFARIVNKAGEVTFSTMKAEIGSVIEQEEETCRHCHESDAPLTALEDVHKSRVFDTPEGHRALSTIEVIFNEPACWSAECHEHEKEQVVLGVLEIGVSLEMMDERVAATAKTVILYGLASVLIVCVLVGLFVHRFISAPVRRLVRATRLVGEGHLEFSPPKDTSDEVGALAGSFVKMTERLAVANEDLKQATEAAVRAEKLAAIGQTITGIAHCVKNMLNGLNAGIYVLKVDLKKKAPDLRDLSFRMIDNNLKRLNALVLDMLTYSKDRVPEYKATNINELILSVVELMEAKAEEEKISLAFHPDESLGEVEIDSTAIYRAVLNLVSNGLEACKEEGPCVDVTTRAEGDKVIIEVKDRGIGMDEETRNSIFTLFFSQKGGQGTGLGLTVTQKIVQEHRGEIEVDSEPGVGSTFRIILPVKHEPAILACEEAPAKGSELLTSKSQHSTSPGSR
ncbi:MAG: two-component system sensor histidine kinase NtrB [Planctomycetota bacterium]|jgi:two-component system NtrC family sensor kinase